MTESRKKQKETKARREGQRIARARRGRSARPASALPRRGVSGGLSSTSSDPAKLAHFGLPKARHRRSSNWRRRWASSSRRCGSSPTTGDLATVSHYRRFLLPKKTGGHRRISAPMPRLKAAQRWVLTTSSTRSRSTTPPTASATAARSSPTPGPHVGADVVINLDLKDFFPTVSTTADQGRVPSLGYSEAVATALSLLMHRARDRRGRARRPDLLRRPRRAPPAAGLAGQPDDHQHRVPAPRRPPRRRRARSGSRTPATPTT
jgi:RNA-directed DNA polymerase